MSTEPQAQADEYFFVLMDPEWEPDQGQTEPPVQAIMGMWPLAEDGRLGLFRGNPEYQPSRLSSPTDPLDGVLRMLAARRASLEQVQVMLRSTLVEPALDEDGRPVIVTAPDGVDCAVVTTNGFHHAGVDAASWAYANVAELIEWLPEGLDVLFNPEGPVPTRLTRAFVQATAGMTDEEVAAANDRFRDRAPRNARIMPNVIGAPDATITLMPAERR